MPGDAFSCATASLLERGFPRPIAPPLSTVVVGLALRCSRPWMRVFVITPTASLLEALRYHAYRFATWGFALSGVRAVRSDLTAMAVEAADSGLQVDAGGGVY